LATVAAPVKSIQWLALSTPPATLHVVNVDNEPDDTKPPVS
jgi:hypothetical protein